MNYNFNADYQFSYQEKLSFQRDNNVLRNQTLLFFTVPRKIQPYHRSTNFKGFSSRNQYPSRRKIEMRGCSSPVTAVTRPVHPKSSYLLVPASVTKRKSTIDGRNNYKRYKRKNTQRKKTKTVYGAQYKQVSFQKIDCTVKACLYQTACTERKPILLSVAAAASSQVSRTPREQRLVGQLQQFLFRFRTPTSR